jgi:hypothetical protein
MNPYLLPRFAVAAVGIAQNPFLATKDSMSRKSLDNVVRQRVKIY